ncbi:MAG: hypothetical protein RR552_02985 [Oscillospiraceae bacterium]
MKKRYIVIPITALLVVMVAVISAVVFTTPFMNDYVFTEIENNYGGIKLERVQYKVTKKTDFLKGLVNRYKNAALYQNPTEEFGEEFYNDGIEYAKELMNMPVEKLKEGRGNNLLEPKEFEKMFKKSIYASKYIPLLFLSNEQGKLQAKAEIERMVTEKDLQSFTSLAEFISYIGENEKVTADDKQWAMGIALMQIDAAQENEVLKNILTKEYSKSFGDLWAN